MSASTNDIAGWLSEAWDGGARWVLIKCDLSREQPEHYPVPFNRAEEVLRSIDNETVEVYDLARSIEAQLAEPRAWHPPEQLPDRIVLGRLEFVRVGHEMFVNRLASDDPDGDGDHIATAEGVWDEVWTSFVKASADARTAMGAAERFRAQGIKDRDRAERLAAALRAKCVLCKRGDPVEETEGPAGPMYVHLLPEGGSHLCTLGAEAHAALADEPPASGNDSSLASEPSAQDRRWHEDIVVRGIENEWLEGGAPS